MEKNHGIELQPDKLELGHKLDSIGEHFIRANYYSEIFQKEMTFNIKIEIK